MFLANEDLSVLDGSLFSVIAMVIVFAVLAILVICIALLSKIKFIEEKVADKPAPVAPQAAPVAVAPQKKLTIEDIKDEDMMVAALVATADFIEETKKTDARVVSIKQIG